MLPIASMSWVSGAIPQAMLLPNTHRWSRNTSGPTVAGASLWNPDSFVSQGIVIPRTRFHFHHFLLCAITQPPEMGRGSSGA
ncbi:hypothetical protein LX36DRAFT_295346 [Colletotrichum falcatum]|nr:hypothetical protein LX36DRAFT_295346 [Colletotrichum falcatum]